MALDLSIRLDVQHFRLGRLKQCTVRLGRELKENFGVAALVLTRVVKVKVLPRSER